MSVVNWEKGHTSPRINKALDQKKYGRSKFNGVKTNFELHFKECEWRYNKSSSLMQNLLNLIKNPAKDLGAKGDITTNATVTGLNLANDTVRDALNSEFFPGQNAGLSDEQVKDDTSVGTLILEIHDTSSSTRSATTIRPHWKRRGLGVAFCLGLCGNVPDAGCAAESGPPQMGELAACQQVLPFQIHHYN